VDTGALLGALRQGRPGQAALDVFDTEPLPGDAPIRDPELIAQGRLLLTPHIGYGSLQTYATMYRETVECLRAWQAGAPVRMLA
jgi:phosphoglycerate dehydrogenase-like enzyme